MRPVQGIDGDAYERPDGEVRPGEERHCAQTTVLSASQDRSSQTFAVAMIPVVGLASLASPTSLQIYHYEHLGTVTIDNNNRIIRVEAE